MNKAEATPTASLIRPRLTDFEERRKAIYERFNSARKCVRLDSWADFQDAFDDLSVGSAYCESPLAPEDEKALRTFAGSFHSYQMSPSSNQGYEERISELESKLRQDKSKDRSKIDHMLHSLGFIRNDLRDFEERTSRKITGFAPLYTSPDSSVRSDKSHIDGYCTEEDVIRHVRTFFGPSTREYPNQSLQDFIDPPPSSLVGHRFNTSHSGPDVPKGQGRFALSINSRTH